MFSVFFTSLFVAMLSYYAQGHIYVGINWYLLPYNARGLNIPYIRLNRTHYSFYHHPSR